jgi:hypothetical protein
MTARTKRGQPIMRHSINAVLAKLKEQNRKG